MIRSRQTTLAQPTTISGPTLFGADHASCTLAPADAGTGIVFQHAGSRIPARADRITTRPVHPAFERLPPRCTGLASPDDTAAVWTVEHVLSALAGLGVRNALVTLDAPEPPILDGSALGYAHAIRSAGIVELDAPLDPIVIESPMRFGDDDASIELTPGPRPSCTYTIDYGDRSPIPRATASWDADPDDYAKRVAPARTFCLESEAQAMRALGLFTHLTERDMLVMGDDGPIDNELRDPHECALHKLLDLIGDLALAGAPIVGEIHAHKSGHALAHDAARALAK